MTIAIPARKGLIVRKIAAERPDLTPKQIAKAAGMNKAYALKAMSKTTFGKDRTKSIAR